MENKDQAFVDTHTLKELQANKQTTREAGWSVTTYERVVVDNPFVTLYPSARSKRGGLRLQ